MNVLARHRQTDQLGWPRWALWAIPLTFPALWFAAMCYSRIDEKHFRWLAREDGWIEYAQALCYALGAGLSAWIAWRLRQTPDRRWSVLYVLFALALFWVAGEEISWGQRLLQFPTPAWLTSHNLQGETNLHNLPGVARTIHRWVGRGLRLMIALSVLVWWVMPGWVARRRRAHLWMPHPALIPAWVCFLGFWPLHRWYVESWYAHAAEPVRVIHRMDEVREFVFALGVAVFFGMVWRAVRREALHSKAERP